MLEKLEEAFGDSKQTQLPQSQVFTKEYTNNGKTVTKIYWKTTSCCLKSISEDPLSEKIPQFVELFQQIESEGKNVSREWDKLRFKESEIMVSYSKYGTGQWRITYNNLPVSEYGQKNLTIRQKFNSLADAYRKGYDELMKIKEDRKKSTQKPSLTYEQSDDPVILFLLNEVKSLKEENKELKANYEILLTGEYKRITTCPNCGGERVIKRTKKGNQFVGCINGKHQTLPMSGLIHRMCKLGLIRTWEEATQY